ncbi:hypothetical protein GRF61_15445 [Azoarcus sp. TTM-91]|uniref:ribonuclease E inhibitor RraB n=1 Tax=Azoarcus sp. TTM-91 TaxID=2691581 RepID=UPI00145ECCBD|nr:ribonuclease E inhibitor RraB [Azoarcus sp. TTM-91]NMG35841.1 hypothetical protein [Azoarcus sp. TTM-91]
MKTTRLSILAIAAVAAVFLFRPSVAAAEASLDGLVIQQLQQAGSDLSQPHSIEFFLYFPSEKAAKAAARELKGFASKEVSPADEGPEWLLLLSRQMKPIEKDLVSLRATFESLAARHGGEYDGWGSPVVRAK